MRQRVTLTCWIDCRLTPVTTAEPYDTIHTIPYNTAQQRFYNGLL